MDVTHRHSCKMQPAYFALRRISNSDYLSADSGTLERVTSIETGKSFGTNNREQERPNLE